MYEDSFWTDDKMGRTVASELKKKDGGKEPHKYKKVELTPPKKRRKTTKHQGLLKIFFGELYSLSGHRTYISATSIEKVVLKSWDASRDNFMVRNVEDIEKLSKDISLYKFDVKMRTEVRLIRDLTDGHRKKICIFGRIEEGMLRTFFSLFLDWTLLGIFRDCRCCDQDCS